MLSDERIMQLGEQWIAAGEIRKGRDFSVDMAFAYALCREQLREIVKWLEAPCTEHVLRQGQPHHDCAQCMSEYGEGLRREAGLEASHE